MVIRNANGLSVFFQRSLGPQRTTATTTLWKKTTLLSSTTKVRMNKTNTSHSGVGWYDNITPDSRQYCCLLPHVHLTGSIRLFNTISATDMGRTLLTQTHTGVILRVWPMGRWPATLLAARPTGARLTPAARWAATEDTGCWGRARFTASPTDAGLALLTAAVCEVETLFTYMRRNLVTFPFFLIQNTPLLELICSLYCFKRGPHNPTVVKQCTEWVLIH